MLALLITVFLAAVSGTVCAATADAGPDKSNQKTESKLDQAEKNTAEVAKETKAFLKEKGAKSRQKIEKANRRKIKTTIKIETPQARHPPRSKRPQADK